MQLDMSMSSLYIKNKPLTVRTPSITDPNLSDTEIVIERDPKLLGRVQECSRLDRSPYLSLIRFDKSTKYSIIPKTTREGYKPRGSARGMIAGPYGVTESDNTLGYFHLRPTVLIRDRSQVWRSGNGERLDRPTSIWERIKAELSDSFGRASSHKFKYRLPAAQLLEVVGLQKIPEAGLIWYAVGACGVAAVALPYLVDKIRDGRNREDLPERRTPPEPREPLYEVYEPDTTENPKAISPQYLAASS
jgi:hypothetical protein